MDTVNLDTVTVNFDVPGGPQRQTVAYLLAILFSAFTFPAQAWDEQQALEFIMANNPVLRSYRTVINEYTPAATTLNRVLEHASIYGKAGAGGTDYQNQPVVLQAGIQIKIPLASTKERQRFAMKAVEETKAINEIQSKVMADLAQLRQHEADQAATAKRLKFYEDKSGWLKKRVEEGYDEVTSLWDIGQKLNEERAIADRLAILLSSVQYQVAHHAGEHWGVLLDYLKGRALLKNNKLSQLK
ncbi:MAG: hypothetical protein ABW168_05625 [Sedimenticola sp.]